MTDTIAVTADAAAPKPEPKSKIIERLLKRARGASMAELTAATGWQQHSIRAAMTGIRKKGCQIIRERRKSGGAAYRLTRVVAAEPDIILPGADDQFPAGPPVPKRRART